MKHKANTNSVSHNPCCLVSERKVEFDEESMLKLVKKDMTFLKEGQLKMQSDITMIKKVLLDPDNGTISKVNRNTDFRKKANAALWSVWVAMIGVIAKLIFWN